MEQYKCRKKMKNENVINNKTTGPKFFGVTPKIKETNNKK